MPYNLNFPQSLDYMRDSQPLMLANYASIFNFIGQDHINFNNGANSGKHAQLTFPPLTAAPASTNEWQLFNIVSQFSTQYRLMSFDALGNVIGFSDRSIQGPGLVNWLQLPSGIIFKWVVLPGTLDSSNTLTAIWANFGDTKPFTTQYWAQVSVMNWIPGDDVINIKNPIFYVMNISDPTRVIYRSWVKDEFSSPTRYNQPRLVLAIGV